MPYSLSHHKLKLILAAQGLKPGDAGSIDTLFGGRDGYYWFGTLRDMCPDGRYLVIDDVESLPAELAKLYLRTMGA